MTEPEKKSIGALHTALKVLMQKINYSESGKYKIMVTIRPLTINERYFDTPVSRPFESDSVSSFKSVTLKVTQPLPATNYEANTTDNSLLEQISQFVLKNKWLFICAAVITVVIIYQNKKVKKNKFDKEVK
jgi:hypothetical protein